MRTLLLTLLTFLIVAGSIEFAFFISVLHPAQLRTQTAVSVLTRNGQATARLQATAKSFEQLYLQTTHNAPLFSDPLKASDMNNQDEFDLAGKSGCVFMGSVYKVSAYESESSSSYYVARRFLNETRCSLGTKSFNDFAVGIQMKIVKGDEGGVVIECNGPPTNPYLKDNHLLFGITRNGFYNLRTYQGSNRKTLLGGRSLVFRRGLLQSNLLVMIVHGNELSLYANGQYVDHISLDSLYTFCKLGLFASSNTQPPQPTIVEFSDLRVWHVTSPSHPTSISSVPNTNDYPMFGYNPQHTHANLSERTFTPDNVSRLTQAWTGATGKSIFSSPVEENGIVYIGSFDRKLYAFDAKTGKLRWSTSTGDSPYEPFSLSTPAVTNGIVYIGTDDGRLKAFDALTGKLRWASASTGAPIVSSPVVADGIVYVGSSDYGFYAFDAMTGSFLWETFTDFSIYSSPAVSNGIVYVGSNDFKLYAFDASTGKTLWTASTGKNIFSSPAVVNGIVYVGSTDGKLYAFGAKTGKTLWTAPTTGEIFSSPAVAHGMVYIGTLGDALYAFDAVTGKLRWEYDSIGPVFSSSVVVGNVVFVGSKDAKLVAVNASTGEYLWAFETGNSIYSSPAVAGGYVYVGSGDSKLYAFHLSQK